MEKFWTTRSVVTCYMIEYVSVMRHGRQDGAYEKDACVEEDLHSITLLPIY